MAKRSIATNEITGLWSYFMTIDWEERWFLYLAAFHALCLVLTALACWSRRTWFQILVFLTFLFLILFSEKLNELAAENWKLFAEQQYFDSAGMFISLVFSTPLLLNSLVLVVWWMVSSFQLAVKSKRLQLAATSRSQQNENKDAKKQQ